MAKTHPPGINAQGVALLNVVIHHGAQQVVGRGDGVQVAGKVQVDALHGHHLGIAAARRAALHAKHRAQRRLAQGQHGVFADAAHAVGQGDGHGGFALTRRGGVDGRDQHQLCALRQIRICALVDLGYITSVGRNGLRQKARGPGDVFNGFQLCFARDFQVRRHIVHAPFCTSKVRKEETACHRKRILSVYPKMAALSRGRATRRAGTFICWQKPSPAPGRVPAQETAVSMGLSGPGFLRTGAAAGQRHRGRKAEGKR